MSRGDNAIIKVGANLVGKVTDYEARNTAARRDISYTNNANQKTFRTEPVERGARFTAYFPDIGETDAALDALDAGLEVSLVIQLNGAGSGEDEISGQFLVSNRADGGSVNGEVAVSIEGIYNTYTRGPQP